MSFLKYAEDARTCAGNGRGPLHFHRADVDGMPFRGPAPLMKEREFEQQVETVYDAKIATFDTSDPQQAAALQSVIDHAANQWFKILQMDNKWTRNAAGEDIVKVFVIWVEPHKELNKRRTPSR